MARPARCGRLALVKRGRGLRSLWQAARERLGRGSALGARARVDRASGPRGELWLILGPRVGAEARARGLANALAGLGHPVVCALSGDVVASDASWRIPWDLARLRGVVADCDQRLRVIVESPTSEAVAIAREARSVGARVLYEAHAHMAHGSGEGWYELENERALVETSDDLIATERAVSRHVAGLALGRRIVHLLPDPSAETSEAWDSIATSLVSIAAQPTVTVLLVARRGAPPIAQALDVFLAARGDFPYRITVVLDASDPDEPDLDERAARGELALLRSPRPGRAAAWNLGIRASTSEIVVLADSATSPSHAGWLEPAVRILCDDRRVGAVGVRSGALPLVARAPEGRSRAALVSVAGLIAPRVVLRHARGMPENVELTPYDEAELCFQIRAQGYELALCPEIGLRASMAEPSGEDRAAAKAFRARWAHRPELFELGAR